MFAVAILAKTAAIQEIAVAITANPAQIAVAVAQVATDVTDSSLN